MKVELLKPISGKAYFKGDIIELSMDQARSYIESGHCIPANEEMNKLRDSPVETAESQQALTASNAQSVVSNKRAKTKR